MAEDEIAVVGQPKGTSLIGYSFVANIDGVRQVTFQHFIAADATDAEVNTDLNRINGFIDRMRAVYELPELKAELEKLQEEVSQYTEDLGTQAEANFGKAQAELQIQLSTLNDDRKKLYDTAYDAFRMHGRQGAFEPKGGTKANLDRYDAGIKQVQDQMAKNVAERDFFVQNTQANIKRRQDRIALLAEKVAEREGLA